jgi:hypothetical protein
VNHNFFAPVLRGGSLREEKKVFGAQSREDAKASGWQEVQRLKQFLCGSASCPPRWVFARRKKYAAAGKLAATPYLVLSSWYFACPLRWVLHSLSNPLNPNLHSAWIKHLRFSGVGQVFLIFFIKKI